MNYLANDTVQIKIFDGFNVYYQKDAYSFVYADFYDAEKLVDGLTDYIFDEDNLLNYAKRTSKIPFTGDEKQYAKLYNNISIFLNEKLELLTVGDINEEIAAVLGEEYHLIDDNGNLLVQNDKVGKIGEYIFHILLTKFFDLDCILPKFRCTTDRNMSVFGIDTLFLDTSNKIIYFGESKFSKDINNGIILANRSLENYEQQIREEYRIVLADEDAFKLSKEFEEVFGEAKQLCISFQKLIEIADIKTIGVPIFIAHGNGKGKNSPEHYINELLTKINKKNFFGLNISYIFISLPVIDKIRFVEVAVKKAVMKQDEYQRRTI